MKDPYHHPHPHHYHRHNNPLQPPSEEEQESAASWVIDKPRTTVAWSKFAASCFCFPGFQQLAHRAGRSMSGLRDDGIYDSLYNNGNIIYDEGNAHHHHRHPHHHHHQEPQTTGVVSSRDDEDENDSRYIPPPPPPIRLHEASHLFHTNHNHHYNHHYHYHNTSMYGGSIVSDMTESELSSCCLSLSEHTSSHKSGSNEDEHNDEGSHEMIATKSWRMMDASLPPLPPPPQAPTSRRNLSNANSNSTSNGSIPSVSHNHKTRAVAAPGKPPVSPHRPPQAPSISLWGAAATAAAAAPTSGSSCNSYYSINNRSFVTTGSFSSAASSSFVIPHTNVTNNSAHGSRNRSFTGDSSSSIASFHRRQSPILTVPTKEHPELPSQLPAAPNLFLPLPPPPPPPLLPSPRLQQQQQQQQFVVVGGGRNRLDSEVSALEMGSEHGCDDDNDDDDENDSVVNSPFPLLELKGDERKHFQPQDSPPPPPPPPPIPRMSPRRLFPNSPKWGKSKSPKHSKKEAGIVFHKRRRRSSRPSSHNRKRPSFLASHEPTNFLCKNSILENSPLLPILDESARIRVRRRVVVSGWIVVLFGNKPQRTHSFPGFGAKDLYYLRIVEESTDSLTNAATASLVLYRSTDGRQVHVFPIEQQWIIESSERKDRRVGRSISILRMSPNNSNDTATARDSLCETSFTGWMEMIPVALHESWRAKLDQRIQDATGMAGMDSRDAAGSTDGRSSHMHGSDENKEAVSGSESTFVILPQPGRFAPDAQLDTARHLFFTIDSFAKQQR